MWSFGSGYFYTSTQAVSAMAFWCHTSVTRVILQRPGWQLGILRHAAYQSKMLSHRGIIGNMTTYGENIMSSVSVTVAQRRKQYVVTGFFMVSERNFFFFSSRLGYAHLSHRLYGWCAKGRTLIGACLRMPTVYTVFLSTLYYQLLWSVCENDPQARGRALF